MSLYNTSQCAGKAARDGTILALAFLKAFSNFLRSYSARGISTDEAEVAERCGARTFGKALERGQGLATVALLDTDVDIVRLRPDVLGGSKRVSLVCEGICPDGRAEVRGKIDKRGRDDRAPRWGHIPKVLRFCTLMRREDGMRGDGGEEKAGTAGGDGGRSEDGSDGARGCYIVPVRVT